MKSSKRNHHWTHVGSMQYKFCSALLLALVACTMPGWAQDTHTPQAYSIAAGSLADALDQLASQSKMQIIYPAELVRGKRAPAVFGQRTWRQVLEKLLADSGLEWKVINTTTVAIRKAEKVPQRTPRVDGNRERRAAAEKTVTDLGSLVVTGSRIRGGQLPSPVITIGSEQIREEGFSDLGEVIRSIPQNFRGGQNPGIVNGATSNPSNQNTSGGSSLNLRGLGPDASLTLLNGRRMSYGGFTQSVDISAIPVDAVDRIEIVADGASAIYGSDAIGGVGNVILKRDFDGVTLGARYGGATEGGLATSVVNATAGGSWATGGLIATYLQSSADAIYASQRDYTDHQLKPRTVYPEVGLKSALVSAHQSLGDRVEFRLDAFRTDREHTQVNSYGSFYYLYPLQTRTSFVSPTVEVALPGDWSLSLGATRGRDHVIYGNDTVATDTGKVLSSARICYCNESGSYEVDAEGPLFALGGGDARLAVGAGYRKNDYLYRSITGTARYGGDERSRFTYAELGLPLIGEESDVRWVHRLELTAAARSEHYSSLGGVTTPKLGMIYGPSEDFTLKASWGKSFKVPTLEQQHGLQQAILFPPGSVGGSGYPAGSTVLYVAGGNPALKPEQARTWTVSLAIHPRAIPNLEAELSWFDIDYTDRVVRPILDYSQAMSNPIYAEFITYSPTPEEQAALIAIAQDYGQFYNLSGLDYNPANVAAAINGLYVNAAGQRVKGLDLSGAYRIDLDEGHLSFRGALSWLDSAQQTTLAHPTYDLSGTLFNPARLNARAGATWTRSGLTASLFGTYTGGVEDTVAAKKTASFTTFDVVLRYATEDDAGPWSGMEFALSAQNVLDRAPPLYFSAPATSHPFDSTNYSAIGRFVSFSVSKHW